MGAFVYLLRCADGTLYCGWSTDPERRLRQHQAGTASRYTRTRRPVELVYTREFATRSEAMREEVRIKRLPPAGKRGLCDLHNIFRAWPPSFTRPLRASGNTQSMSHSRWLGPGLFLVAYLGALLALVVALTWVL